MRSDGYFFAVVAFAFAFGAEVFFAGVAAFFAAFGAGADFAGAEDDFLAMVQTFNCVKQLPRCTPVHVIQ